MTLPVTALPSVDTADAKPIFGVIQLLPLPGSPDWQGDLEAVFCRAEQDACALASAGVDGVLLTNTQDGLSGQHTLDPAAILAWGRLIEHLAGLVPVPIGISVYPHDPHAALAMALNSPVALIHLPVVLGTRVMTAGLIQGQSDLLKHAIQRLKLLSLPVMLGDVSDDIMLPGTHHVFGLERFRLVRNTLAQQSLLDGGVIATGSVESSALTTLLADPLAVAALHQHQPLPLWLWDTDPDVDVLSVSRAASGVILQAHLAPETPASPAHDRIDVYRTESLVKQLRQQAAPSPAAPTFS
jgi:predicted TIM-barrel enzyme